MCALRRGKPPSKQAFGRPPAARIICSRCAPTSFFRRHSRLFVRLSGNAPTPVFFSEKQGEDPMYTQLGLYIDGKWNHGNGAGGEDVINPATAKPLAHLPHASIKDLDAALASAQAGFKLWKAKSAYDRGRIIKKAADLVRDRADAIATVLTQEQGKSFVEAKGEVVTSADIVEW